ncbi:MAG: hypothetical protein EP318_15500 [Rhodobacteraceae bacterium]|nr:MAG: hypothetical protein EP318_15500 [Paracoccaceae bacterium]
MSSVTIRGRDFADAEEAARAFGVKVDTIRRVRAMGKLDRVGLPRGTRLERIKVRGKRFVSVRAAADFFGVSPKTVYGWIAAEARGETLKPVHWKANSRPVRVGAWTFPSINRAERLLGLPRGTFARKDSAARTEAILGAAMRYPGHPASEAIT